MPIAPGVPKVTSDGRYSIPGGQVSMSVHGNVVTVMVEGDDSFYVANATIATEVISEDGLHATVTTQPFPFNNLLTGTHEPNCIMTVDLWVDASHGAGAVIVKGPNQKTLLDLARKMFLSGSVRIGER